MKYTLEDVKQYAGKIYDDGNIKGTIAGYYYDGGNLGEVLVVFDGLDNFYTPVSDWARCITIVHNWEGEKSVKWIKNFDPKYIVKEEYYYMDEKIEPEVPEWWDGRPVLVYYSDSSVEGAIKDGDIRWLVGIRAGSEKYILSDCDILHRDIPYKELSSMDELMQGDTTTFTFVAPVPKKDLEINPEKTEDKIEFVIRRNGEEELVEITEEQLKKVFGDE